MYSYTWDEETGGILLNTTPLKFSKEPRPVYYQELDLLGFDKFWKYPKDDAYPFMWAEANNYFYRGRLVAKTKGGTLYTAPEIVIVDQPEPDGAPLRFVDIDSMVCKNKRIIDGLTQETIKKVYNTYIKYKDKVDIFHVSYSGGKDSEVNLDIVQRALPHNAFIVIFADTKMEFPDTYKAINKTREICKDKRINFYKASSNYDPVETWNVFGPPAKTLRWCCSVHKTTPQLLLLREIAGKENAKEMAFVGVRRDESLKRKGYDYVSLGTKHKGQYSCNPILDWNSAEVYLYIYENRLQINEAYKKGNARAGCLVCPMSGDKADYIRRRCYKRDFDEYINIIKRVSNKEFENEAEYKHYIEVGGWKLRVNGRDIKALPIKYNEKSNVDTWEIKVCNPETDWKEWIKTIGDIYTIDKNNYFIKKGGACIEFELEYNDKEYKVRIKKAQNTAEAMLLKRLKQVFRKAAYCIKCKECQADCNNGCINMTAIGLKISDDCVSCGNCHKAPGGCLLYKSLVLPMECEKMNKGSLDRYADHAPKMEWIRSFFELKNNFLEEHGLGKVMISNFKKFLRDANLIDNNKLTPLADLIGDIGLYDAKAWALMLTNLSYSSEVQWYLKNLKPLSTYTKIQLIDMLQASGAKERASKSITGAYRRILALPFGKDVGMGKVTKEGKEYQYYRGTWSDPDPLVILYSLYKFAEACGGYYHFTLKRLMDHDVESEGMSPSEIFGLDEDTMKNLINGLSVQYPEYINASFTLGLDNIDLREDKKSQDVLELF